ncbi:MAG: hypothetical protein SPLUMA1_SPLUMAMAG1_01771 [uncultured Sulfurimonas sp.]|nr:MAG: hypothetical protein SPLUMA1_SPLUMAMAG1_01771 [uncultured Sulfurimonas sp.]
MKLDNKDVSHSEFEDLLKLRLQKNPNQPKEVFYDWFSNLNVECSVDDVEIIGGSLEELIDLFGLDEEKLKFDKWNV